MKESKTNVYPSKKKQDILLLCSNQQEYQNRHTTSHVSKVLLEYKRKIRV